MTPALNMSQSYTDLASLEPIRAAARRDDPEALKAVARQFEGLFLQMMLKSMREASFGDPLLESNGMNTYQDLYDKQLSVKLSAQGTLGLAEVLIQQMQSQFGALLPDGQERKPATDKPVETTYLFERRAPLAAQAGGETPSALATDHAAFKSPGDFIQTLMPEARKVAAELGVEPKLLLAQAALETGWGQALIRHADGRNSFNLFGIKADAGWQGPRVEVMSQEFISGRPYQVKSAFRAYSSYADSFKDYVQFLRGGRRYSEALKGAADGEAYMRGLQAAGYATDPHYADKVIAISRREGLWRGA